MSYNISEKDGKSIKFCYAKNIGIIFLAAGYEGIFVIDSKTNEILMQQKFGGEFVNGFDSTVDGNYIFMPFKNEFTIFTFSLDSQ
jgi:hypothetical protein